MFCEESNVEIKSTAGHIKLQSGGTTVPELDYRGVGDFTWQGVEYTDQDLYWDETKGQVVNYELLAKDTGVTYPSQSIDIDPTDGTHGSISISAGTLNISAQNFNVDVEEDFRIKAKESAKLTTKESSGFENHRTV